MNAKAVLLRLGLFLGTVLLITGALFQTPLPTAPATHSGPDQPGNPEIATNYGQLPLSFEANLGQTDSQVKFLSRGGGYTLFLTPTEAVLSLRKPAPAEAQDTTSPVPMMAGVKDAQAVEQAVLRMELVGANPAPQVVGLAELPGKVNYFLGNDPAKWRTNVPTYARVKYQSVYPGVDLVYYGNQGQLEYDFVVAPGADPEGITLSFEGAERVQVVAQGDLLLDIGGEQVRMGRPLIYQEVADVRQEISGNYVVKDFHQIGFQLGTYDVSRPLVLDPVLHYSSYLGGASGDSGEGDWGFGVAVDADGAAYVAGITPSTDFPTTPGAFQMTFPVSNPGVNAVFVTKLNADGSGLVYSTYLGGDLWPYGLSMALDSSGAVYVTGTTRSASFPVTSEAFQVSSGGGSGGTCGMFLCFDAFVSKLSATGSELVYSTFLGGNNEDYGIGIAECVKGFWTPVVRV